MCQRRVADGKRRLWLEKMKSENMNTKNSQENNTNRLLPFVVRNNILRKYNMLHEDWRARNEHTHTGESGNEIQPLMWLTPKHTNNNRTPVIISHNA